MKKGIIAVGGAGPEMDQIPAGVLSDADFIIAADSGYDLLFGLQIIPDLIIGDMDSVESALPEGIPVLRYPKDKDFTDTELAVKELELRNIRDWVLLGGGEGRLDHLYALLNLYRNSTAPKLWITARETIYTLEDTLALNLGPDSSVSIISLSEKASKVTTSGLKWELKKSDLSQRRPSISNQNIEESISLILEEGPRLLVVVNHS